MKKQIRKDKRKRRKARAAWPQRREARARRKDERRRGAGEARPEALGREGSRTLVRNRCVETGYARSVRRWHRLTGQSMRRRARAGQRPGVYKRSW